MRPTLASVFAVLLAGCPDPSSTTPPTAPSPGPVEDVFHAHSMGTAPWDPLVARGPHEDLELQILDAGGAPMEMEALVDQGGTPWGIRGAGAGLPPGSYTLVAAEMAEPIVAWTVEDVGWTPGFDPSPIVGRVFEAVPSSEDVGLPSGWGDLALVVLDENAVFVEILEVEGGDATLRIVADLEDQGACQILKVTGTLSDTGRLDWSLDALDWTSPPTLSSRCAIST